MLLSRDRLEALATDTSFQPEALEKVMRLGELLKDIYQHPLLSKVLLLKGGTALNLFFGPPQRLSVDMDFNYVGSVEREQMLRERPQVERAISTIGKGQGYRVQVSKQSHAGRKIYLFYVSVMGTPNRVELDLNYLFRIPLGTIQVLPMWQPADLEQPQAKIVSSEELYAGKVCALLDRVMPRDLFDITRLPEHQAGALLNSPTCKKIIVALAATLPHPLHTYRQDRLDRVTEQHVREQLNPMLISTARLTTTELKEKAWEVVEPLLQLDEAELQYINRIHVGQICPELLFPDDAAICEMLSRHPAIRWKIENVLRHRPN